MLLEAESEEQLAYRKGTLSFKRKIRSLYKAKYRPEASTR
jgi:hypothetical protein